METELAVPTGQTIRELRRASFDARIAALKEALRGHVYGQLQAYYEEQQKLRAGRAMYGSGELGESFAEYLRYGLKRETDGLDRRHHRHVIILPHIMTGMWSALTANTFDMGVDSGALKFMEILQQVADELNAEIPDAEVPPLKAISLDKRAGFGTPYVKYDV